MESGENLVKNCLTPSSADPIYPVPRLLRSCHGLKEWATNLAAQKSHRKIAVTTVAASGLATIPLQKSQSFSLRRPQTKSLAASDFWVTLQIAGSSQRPWPQVAAAARFCGRSDHGTLRRRTEQVKTGQMNLDHLTGHFRGHFRGRLRGAFRGSFRGSP